MKIIFLIIFIYSTLFSYEVEEEKYLGSNYNLYLAFEPSCLRLLGNTDVINENVGVLGKLSFCDDYINDSQDHLEQLYSIGTGISLYNNSIYRDSFFTTLIFSLNKTFLTDIFTGTTGNSLAISSVASLGYQWHFERGYIISLAAYASYRFTLSYDDKSDIALKDELSKNTTKLTPTLLLGWRF